jgi:sialic acid synthase SpsE
MLFGFQAEPTRVGDNNLARLQALHERFPDLSLGFMDHSDGGADEAGWLGLLTLPYGITTIEKHITLDRSLKLEDHMSALDPTQFERYVRRIRLGEAALGSADLQPLEAERAYRSRAVKKVVAARRLAKSRILQCSDLKLLRASTDHQTQMFEQISDVVGRRLVSPLAAEQAVHPEHLA